MAEPWCKSVAEIRKLTDWQVHNLIFLPALRAAAKRDQDQRAMEGLPPKKKRKTRLPTKEEYFLVGERIGMPRDRLEQEWAKAQNGKPEPR